MERKGCFHSNEYICALNYTGMNIGKYNDLEVKALSLIGVYLTDGKDDVLLPKKYVTDHPNVGDTMSVFVYLDNENRPIATTLEPNAHVDDFVFLTVKDVNTHGAFLDWGISKDIFVPYAEQRSEMKVGRKYLVYVFVDERSGRIAATTKWINYITKEHDLEIGEEVRILVAEKTDLGFKVIIENLFEGLMYKNELFDDIKEGEYRDAFIKTIRLDGKIDVSLQPVGFENIDTYRDIILEELKGNNGSIPLGDKSPAEEIYRLLKMSKKNFKRGIGGLYKDRLITLSDLEIKLVK